MYKRQRLFVNKTPKGEYRYAWGINFPKELAPFDVHLIPVNVKDEASLALKMCIRDSSILTPEQKARIDALKYKIYNHIDHKDLVSLGYPDSGSKGASGIVKHLKTKNLKNIGLQHMMHGYIYDKDGNLVLEKGTEAILSLIHI